MTSSLIGQQLVAFLAAALKAAHCVSTHMITPPIVKTALINVCEQKNHPEEWIHQVNDQKENYEKREDLRFSGHLGAVDKAVNTTLAHFSC